MKFWFQKQIRYTKSIISIQESKIFQNVCITFTTLPHLQASKGCSFSIPSKRMLYSSRYIRETQSSPTSMYSLLTPALEQILEYCNEKTMTTFGVS